MHWMRRAAAAGLSAPFSPLGLGSWLFYARADGGLVDQSGNGCALTARPTFPTVTGSDAGLNNQASFSCAAKAFSVALPSSPTFPYTIWLVGAQADHSVLRVASDGTPGNAGGWGQVTSNAGPVYIYDGAQRNSVVNPDPNFALIGEYRGDATSNILVNSLGAGLVTGSAGSIASSSTLYVGSDVANAAFWTGRIAEFGIRLGALSAPAKSQLMTYASTRYGVTVGA